MGRIMLAACHVVTILAGVLVAHAAGEPGTTCTTRAMTATSSTPVPPVFPIYWIKIHGWLMWISMGFLMPLGIILVRFSKIVRENGDLRTLRKVVYVHIFIQVVAVFAVISSAIVGVSKFDNTFPYTHERLGLSLWILVLLAPLVGLARPKHGVRFRPVWYATHWLFGTGGVILGIINIFIGMHVYELITGRSLRTLNILFAIQVGAMAVVYLAQDRWQYLIDQGRSSKTIAPSANGQRPRGALNEYDEHHHLSVQIAPSA